MVSLHFKRLLAIIFVLFATIQSNTATSSFFNVLPKAIENGLDFEIGLFGEPQLKGVLGLSLPLAVGNAVNCTSSPGGQCFQYGDFANVTVSALQSDNCVRIEWQSTYARRLEDCFTINNGTHIYGSGEMVYQYWPINAAKKNERPYIVGGGDFYQGQNYGGVVENYWLLSSGAAIHVDEDNPLFLSWDTVRPQQLCFVSADEYPYKRRDNLSLKYDICVGNNLKDVHQKTMEKFFKKPREIVDETMLVRPLWSTWAQYKADINQSIVLDFARRVVSEGFQLSSHIEIDDKWEACYGMEEFNSDKFPDPAAMVKEINGMDMRVTLWVHPFINFDCSLFQTGVQEGYFVKDPKGKTGITSWWAGGNSGIIDMTNDKAVEWWTARLEKLRTEIGIDAFKFDAGEIEYLPHSVDLNGDENMSPNLYATKYVEVLSRFGGLVEARVARQNQEQPIFVRPVDKLTHWGYDSGLKSMIPTVLHFGIIGYPFCLPDMIGGNAYGDWPSKELYIRWMQVNIFMPAVQFSLVPWDSHFDSETVEICKGVLNLREQYKDEILGAARQAVADGSPMNRPLWWVDPTDPETFTVDQEYMLGDRILVAPVVIEGATSRDIYLPVGKWIAGVDNKTYDGPLWLRDYPAPLNVVPYFLKEN